MKTRALLTISAVICAAIPAQADWLPDDNHKMHFPQLPDPNGWDIDATTDFIYDDWQCSETGTVADVHLWMSWQNENIGQLSGVIVEIWDDVPSGVDTPYSHPGVPLWSSGTLNAGQFNVIPAGNGDQGWYAPTIAFSNPVDHNQFFQVNIQDFADPFVQQQGEIYWLGVHLLPGPGEPQPMAGWKTTRDPFQDDAVWWDPTAPNPNDPPLLGYWNELIDPTSGASLDMAFVITPEPSSPLLTLLGAGLCCLRRRRR